MKRRSFLAGLGVGAGAAAGAAPFSSSAAANSAGGATRKLKMVTTWPKNFPGLGMTPERIAKRMHAATDGRIDIRVYGAGELVPAFEAFDAVSGGAADMYHGAEYYWQGKSKAFNFFTSVPFGMNAAEINSWVYYGGGQQLWDDLSAGFNIKPLLAGNTGVQMGGWYNREIKSAEDFKGLKIRMPGLGGEVLRRLGAAAVALPGGEIFPALQSGAIDATEWVGPWNDLAFGFYKITKYYYYPGFHEPGAALAVGFNRDFWQSLSARDQAIFAAVCAAENEVTLAEFNARNSAALEILQSKHGVKLNRFSDEVLAAIGKASGEVLAEVAAADPVTAKVYQSFLAARKSGMTWARLSEEAYSQARRLEFPYG